MKLRNIVAAIVGTAFLAMASFAQTTSKLEGVVTGLDGKPLAGAVIKLTRTDMKGFLQLKTNKNGRYIAIGLSPLSIYTITCEVDGKKVDEKQNVKATLSDINNPVANDGTIVNFDLKKKQAENASTEQALDEALTTGKISPELSRRLTDDQKDSIEKTVKDREASLKKNKDLNDAFSMGKTAMDAKQYSQAVGFFEKAAGLGPNQIEVWENLAEAHISLAATETGPDFDAESQKGIDAYSKAIDLKPDDVNILTNYARALALSKKFPEAQAQADKIAQISPGAAGKAYYNLGATLTNIGQSEPAVAAFKKAMEANYADAFYQYGIYLTAKAQVDSATGKITPAPGTVEAFQKYLDLAPAGAYAQPAKDMIASLGATVDTSYKNPNAQPAAAPKAPTATTTTKKK
jgi:tetratricopeptide (TPR) repeat protein